MGSSEQYEMNISKLEQYCALQDRCTFEATMKMKRLGMNTAEIEKATEYLKDAQFIDHARYAESYVRGKFRMKHWGKIKIKSKLYSFGIEIDIIEGALSSLDSAEYEATCRNLINRRFAHKNVTSKAEEASLIRYMQQKGFELHIILKELNRLKHETS